MSSDFPACVADGDSVILNGGGVFRNVTVKCGTRVKLGRAGMVDVHSLVGVRFGSVVGLQEKGSKRILVPSSENPDLDRSALPANAEETRDNRDLQDTHGSNQALTNDDLAVLKETKGVSSIVPLLVESSATFASKTAFSQEKYIRKKKAKYADLFKVERFTPDNTAELNCPTVKVDASGFEEQRFLRLRVDTMAHVLHHGNVHGDARIMTYDDTCGTLQAAMLNRMGPEGRIFHVLDKRAQPNLTFALQMKIPLAKDRWRCIPRSTIFFGLEQEKVDEEVKQEAAMDDEQCERKRASQWIKAADAREMLLADPVDSLIIADEEPVFAVRELLPFLALSGNIVVYCPFLEPLTRLFSELRNDAVCIRIFDLWYRHYQVLPSRTHPTVNMNTAGGYLLTAIRVEHNAAPSPRYLALAAEAAEEAVGRERRGVKRSRE